MRWEKGEHLTKNDEGWKDFGLMLALWAGGVYAWPLSGVIGYESGSKGSSLYVAGGCSCE